MAAHGAWTVETFPRDPVRLACGKCGRSGQYRKATLADRFGAHATMPDVRRKLADCPRECNASDPCAAYYPDLARGGFSAP